MVVVDADGRERSTLTNRAGNFYFEGRESEFPLPYAAYLRFLLGGKIVEPVMFMVPAYGGCARCHSRREVAALGGARPPRTDIDLDFDAEEVALGGTIYPPGLYDD